MGDELDDYVGYYEFIRGTWSPPPITGYEEFSPSSATSSNAPPMSPTSSTPMSPEGPSQEICPLLEVHEDFPPVPIASMGDTPPSPRKKPRLALSLFQAQTCVGQPAGRAVEDTRGHEGNGCSDPVTATGEGEVGRGYDDYQRGGTPLPDVSFALSAAEHEGANFRRYDDYHEGGTPPPNRGACSSTESYVYRHDQCDTRVDPGFETHTGEGRETAWELPTVEVSMLDNCWHSEAKGDEGNVKDEPVVEIVTV